MKEIGTLDNLGFTPVQLRHFQELQHRYQHGEFNLEWTTKELRRLHYVRWLVAQGRMSG